MSTSVATKPPTFIQRAKAAHEHAAKTLDATDTARFIAALAEVAAEEIERNSNFRLRVLDHYGELAPKKTSRSSASHSKTTATSKKRLEDFIPEKRVEGHVINLAAALNPYDIYEGYGATQFRDVLMCFTVKQLQEAVEIVQDRQLGTKPKNKTKSGLVDFLVQTIH